MQDTAAVRPGGTRKSRAATATESRRGVSPIARVDPGNALVVVTIVGVALVLAGAIADHAVRSAVTHAVHLLPLLLLAAAVIIPVIVAVVQRPQRGVLLIALLIPFHGLLTIAPHKPAFAEGWKEALTLLTLAATFRPGIARTARRPWPKVWQAGAFYFVVGLVSAVVVGGTQGAV